MVGAGFGLVRGLRLLDGLADHSPEIQALGERLDGMETQITALHARDDQLQVRMDRAATKDELSAALDKALEDVQNQVDARFDDQMRSVEALRTMVVQTDELLERVLDRLESMRSDTELQRL